MKVLIVGGGGREHAIAVSMKKSKRVEKLYCVPGNAGIAQIAECEPSIGVMEFEKVVAYAKEKAVDLVFVAPDDPFKKIPQNSVQMLCYRILICSRTNTEYHICPILFHRLIRCNHTGSFSLRIC